MPNRSTGYFSFVNFCLPTFNVNFTIILNIHNSRVRITGVYFTCSLLKYDKSVLRTERHVFETSEDHVSRERTRFYGKGMFRNNNPERKRIENFAGDREDDEESDCRTCVLRNVHGETETTVTVGAKEKSRVLSPSLPLALSLAAYFSFSSPLSCCIPPLILLLHLPSQADRSPFFLYQGKGGRGKEGSLGGRSRGTKKW